MNYTAPSTRYPPEIVIEGMERGYDVTVGFTVGMAWHPCATEWAFTAWGASRRAKRLIRWYERYVARQIRAKELQAEIPVTRSD